MAAFNPSGEEEAVAPVVVDDEYGGYGYGEEGAMS
jgi:hypothetical protein